jgi:hypothetical protein
MALSDFWISVRTAARLLIPPRVIADSPRVDAASIEARLRQADLWLTPRAVEGFAEKDFDFLPDEERKSLANLVNEFRSVASRVDPKGPIPTDVVDRAAPLFRDIVQRLGFDRYEDAEAYRLGKQIEQTLTPHWPEEIAELRFKTGLDQTGDPGLWIWAILNDAASRSDDQFLQNAQRLRPLLDTVARQVAPDRWPYLSFRSLAEQLEPAETS